MKIRSHSFDHGQPIPAEFALGASEGFGGNRNPHLIWQDAPAHTRSFVLLCVDTDAPTDASLAGKPGVEIPVEHPRGDFIHWVLADLPASVNEIAAGAAADGPVKGGKTASRFLGARQGLNDYTGWFAHDQSGMRGEYFGYDGPYPPPNDLRVHRYFFRLFALDVEQLELPERFTAHDVLTAMHGHVLAEASLYGTYWLNAKAAPGKA